MERTYSISDMSHSVQDTKTMGNTQDFSNIKCNVLSSTQKNSSDLNIMGRVPYLWANTIQNNHKSCQYCLYHFLSLPSGYNLFGVIFLTETKSNLCTALTIEKTVAVNCMHKKQPNFSLPYVHQFLVVNTQRSDFPCTTIAKVKPILMSRQQYHHEHLQVRTYSIKTVSDLQN